MKKEIEIPTAYELTPSQIRKLNAMKHLTLDPALGATLLLPELGAPTEATVICGAQVVKITVAEAFRL